LNFSYNNPSDSNAFGIIRYNDGTSTPARWNGIMLYLEHVIDSTKQNDTYLLNTQPTRDQIIKLTVPPTFDSNGVLTSGPTFTSTNVFFSSYYSKVNSDSNIYNILKSNYYASINNKNNKNNSKFPNNIDKEDLITNMKTWIQYYNNYSINNSQTDKYYWFTTFLTNFIKPYKPNTAPYMGIYKEYTNNTYSTSLEYSPGVSSPLSTSGEQVYLQINKDTYSLALQSGTYKFGIGIINDVPIIQKDSDRNIFPFSVSDFALAKFVIDSSLRPVVSESLSGLTVQVIYYE